MVTLRFRSVETTFARDSLVFRTLEKALATNQVMLVGKQEDNDWRNKKQMIHIGVNIFERFV